MMSDEPEIESLPEIELLPAEDHWIECDNCAIGLAGGVDQFCAALDAIAIRVHNKDGRIEALKITSQQWTDIGRATVAKVSPMHKEPKT